MTTPDVGEQHPKNPPPSWVRQRLVASAPLMRRALGEFALIVCSVLVALWVNEWKGAQDRQQSERTFLTSIHEALEADLSQLNAALVEYRQREGRMSTLLARLDQGAPYTDSMRTLFGAAYGVNSVEINRAPYEALKALDLSLVQDEALRMALSDLYERTYVEYEKNAAADRSSILELRPYFLREFHDIRFIQSAVPNNPAAVLRDPYFHNLVDYRLTVFRANKVAATAHAVDEVKKVLALFK